MEDYKDYIFRQPEIVIEEITGEDVDTMVQSLKETAGGLDQWDPADLKLLSKEACKGLAAWRRKKTRTWTPWTTEYY